MSEEPKPSTATKADNQQIREAEIQLEKSILEDSETEKPGINLQEVQNKDKVTKNVNTVKETENVEVTRAKKKVYQIKSQIDDLVDQFFESKLEKVKNNEQMIVNYKFQPKIRQAKERLKHIEFKVEE